MKAKKYFVYIACMIAFATPALALVKKKTKGLPARKTHAMGAKLGTNFNMNDVSVHGRYDNALGGVSTIENEKIANDLLDYRTEYKDRLQRSLSQQ